MLIPLLILAVLAVAVIWLIVYTLRRPKKPDHDREPERFRDPAITAYEGGPSGGSF
jgi:hypothetical protein